MSKTNRARTRYVALDVHKHYIMLAAVNREQDLVLAPRKLSIAAFLSWSQQHLRASDELLMEASTNIWFLCDHLQPLVASVSLANPYQVKLIAASVVKTDKRDTLALARLLAAKIIPTVWIPTPAVRDLRRLIAHRRALNKQIVATKNRLHAVLHRHALTAPKGGLFAVSTRQWWLTLALSPVEQLQLQHDLQVLDQSALRLHETDTLLTQLSVSERWFRDARLLIQIPGIAVRSAMTILSAIGAVSRFETAKALTGYAGLDSRVQASGNTYHTGGITKRGRPELRTSMVTCAWRSIRYCPYWREQFQRLAKRRGRHRAIVAIARRLLVAIWHILTHQLPDRHADPALVRPAFRKWAYQHGSARSLGLSAREFVAKALSHIQAVEMMALAS